jgi:hypothetical protein
LKPSGWIYLFTICRSVDGPMAAAYVPERKVSAAEAANGNMKQKVYEK